MSEEPDTQEDESRAVVAAVTEVGNVRDHNEDAYFVDEAGDLFIISDGMGGHQAGEYASKAVVTVLPKMIRRALDADPKMPAKSLRDALVRSIAELSKQLREESAGQAGLAGMGATVVMTLLRREYAYIAHMGDSRAYLLRDGVLRQLTDDHSVVGILLRSGQITAEEAKDHPARGSVSRYVGMEGDALPDVQTVRLKAGDRLLLCTDGLSGMVSDDAIVSLLADHSEAEPACQVLVEAAKASGGRDNITVVVVDWGRW
ncbi:MAG: Stp1/IreP family PP2C-type Ser/Thr phosphatase [Phycisphaerae bacterium]|nr:Stp1/IreP family PP2C-type Ser/Thr phosphatase [Phycisphaerae bacterium]